MNQKGDPLSPYLFNLILDWIIQFLPKGNSNSGEACNVYKYRKMFPSSTTMLPLHSG